MTYTSVRASHEQIVEVGKTFMATSRHIEKIEGQLVAARESQIERLMRVCDGIAPVTEAEFDQTWRPTLFAIMQSSYKDAQSCNTAISGLKVAVIAFTNNIKPEEGDTTLTKFIRSARAKVRANGLMKEGAGRKLGSGNGQDKKKSAREEAMRLLAVTEANLPEDVVEQRVEALRLILKHSKGWEHIIRLANTMNEM